MQLLVIFLLFVVKAWCICPNNTVSWNSKCYFFITNLTGFEDAELSCIGLGGHLAPIHDGFTNGLLGQEGNKYFHDSTETDFWIGLSNLMAPGNWTWTDGTQFDFSDWNKGEPKNISGSNCAALSLTDGYWSAQDCFKNRPFVCEVPSSAYTIPPTIPPYPDHYNCSLGFTYFKPTHSCYGYGKSGNQAHTVATWHDALLDCQSQGADLVSLHSYEEEKFLATYVFVTQSAFWIGLYSIDDEKTFRWSDGTSLDYTNWDNGQPHLNVSSCVLEEGWGLVDAICTETHYFICKKPIS